MILAVGPEQAETLASIHAHAFDHSWDGIALRNLLTAPGALALADEAFTGFVLLRVVMDEAEILTLAVRPASRRRGLARRLLEAASAEAAKRGAATLFLEVAADNDPALALYKSAGFAPVGRRAGYYARPSGVAVDAQVLKKPLSSTA